mmetsp:Transcript_71796/g.156329  ORF Transcript_71796/g.156329 Transcript_71796/m.156329 type:complete len:229 (-) Transcript_71796:537-1223(-)
MRKLLTNESGELHHHLHPQHSSNNSNNISKPLLVLTLISSSIRGLLPPPAPGRSTMTITTTATHPLAMQEQTQNLATRIALRHRRIPRTMRSLRPHQGDLRQLKAVTPRVRVRRQQEINSRGLARMQRMHPRELRLEWRLPPLLPRSSKKLATHFDAPPRRRNPAKGAVRATREAAAARAPVRARAETRTTTTITRTAEHWTTTTATTTTKARRGQPCRAATAAAARM